MSTISELLKSRGLYARCPNCDGKFAIQRAQLFDATTTLPRTAAEYLRRETSDISNELKEMKVERKELSQRSSTAAESTGVGNVVEMLSPSLSGFPLAPSDCRALLKPVDYIGFKGLTTKGQVDAVVFLEVKSGRGRLTPDQRDIRSVVERQTVRLLVADHLFDDE